RILFGESLRRRPSPENAHIPAVCERADPDDFASGFECINHRLVPGIHGHDLFHGGAGCFPDDDGFHFPSIAGGGNERSVSPCVERHRGGSLRPSLKRVAWTYAMSFMAPLHWDVDTRGGPDMIITSLVECSSTAQKRTVAEPPREIAQLPDVIRLVEH